MSQLTRRLLVGAGVATGGGLASGARSQGKIAAGEAGMDHAARIDVHQHIIPPEFLAALARHGMSAWAPAP